jgi:hypothetical protein
MLVGKSFNLCSTVILNTLNGGKVVPGAALNIQVLIWLDKTSGGPWYTMVFEGNIPAVIAPGKEEEFHEKGGGLFPGIRLEIESFILRMLISFGVLLIRLKKSFKYQLVSGTDETFLNSII